MTEVWTLVKTNVWFLLFFLWGIPLGVYRSRFRKMVYRTDSWTINVLPYFRKEIQALFGNLYPNDEAYLRLRNFYRVYLLAYGALFLLWLASG